MRLKKRLLTQSLVVLMSTVLATTCISLIFSYFFTRIYDLPVGNTSSNTDVVLLKGEELLYASSGITTAEAQEILMHVKMGDKNVQMSGKMFGFDLETFRTASGEAYRVIKITPLFDVERGYTILVVFVSCVFLISFLVASLLAQQYNRTHLIEPIVHLKEATEKLIGGELDVEMPDEGEGEVYELHLALEQLRVKLKDSVYYERKFDENRQFLVSSISHDLKTPVTAIRGYIEGILDGVASTDEKREKYLREALQKIDLMHTMIDDLLLYSKLDLNQVAFETTCVSIADYLQSCLDDHQFAFMKEEKQLSMQNELWEPCFVWIDTNRFSRVVQNILDNAKKNIAPKTGTVQVYIRQKLHNVVLEFCDNGIGIQESELPHIFDRFYRADSARKIRGSSGLGLAIAKQIVEGLDGRIWATSTPGKGTSILISLKMQPASKLAQKESEKEQ